MSILLATSVVMTALIAPDDVARVIRLHGDTLARVKSIYIKTEMWEDSSQRGGVEKSRKLGTTETWRMGLRERFFERIYEIVGPQGVEKIPEGLLRDRSLDDKEVRDLDGWDPDRVDEMPLSFTHGITCAKVTGAIFKRGPEATTCHVWRAILFEVHPGISLAQAAKVSEIILLPPESPGTILLEIKASQIDYLVGMRIELDPERGYLFRRRSFQKRKAFAEVKEFSKLAEGIWVPRRVFMGLRGSASLTRVEVVACRVNAPIADANLQVRFPKGTLVLEPEKGLYHRWGKDGPEKTFTNEKDWENYITKVTVQELSGRVRWLANIVFVCVSRNPLLMPMCFPCCRH